MKFIKKICLIMACLMCFSFVACDKDDQSSQLEQSDLSDFENNESSSETPTSPQKNYSEHVKLVLDRDIFVLKNDFPDIYTAALNGIDTSDAYIYNWKLNRILNEECFENIQWDVAESEGGGSLVSFRGDYKDKDKTVYYIQFHVSDDSMPLALSLYTYSDKDQSELSVNMFKDMESSYAIIYTDVAISCMLSLLTNDVNENDDPTNDIEDSISDYEDLIEYPLYRVKIEAYSLAASSSPEEYEQRYFVQKQWEDYTFDEPDCEWINGNFLYYDYLNYKDYYDLAYALYDVDKNGTPELLISVFEDDTNAYSNTIDVYTISDDQLIKLFPEASFSSRDRLHVTNDGKFVNEGSDGAYSSSCIVYEISQDKKGVVVTDEFYFDKYDDLNDPANLGEDKYHNKLDGLLNNSIINDATWTRF